MILKDKYDPTSNEYSRAVELVEAGAARLLEPQALSGTTLAAALTPICEAPSALQRMSAAAGKLAHADATTRILDLCTEWIGDARKRPEVIASRANTVHAQEKV